MEFEKLEAFDTLSLHLFKVNGLMQDWGDYFAEPFNLTASQWKILGALISEEQALTVPEISHIMGISRQGIQKQVNTLLEGEYLEKVENPQHKRSVLYKVTQKGEEVYQSIHDNSTKYLDERSQGITLEELEKVNHVLNELINVYTLPEERK
ncbi:MAG: MarR family transcriptional regulator [Bacteroidia bacterium]|nr:MarR family transcriptional regulator [Bacteroidia bacterium]